MPELNIEHLPPVLTAKEVAELFRVTPDQIYRLCRQKKLEHVRFGRWVRIPRSVVCSLLSHSTYDKKEVNSVESNHRPL